MIGTIGVPMTVVETRLESVPEIGYDALSSKPTGEICLRGATLFSGYHKRKDLTEDVLIDGWLHTGIFATSVQGHALINLRKMRVYHLKIILNLEAILFLVVFYLSDWRYFTVSVIVM